MTKSNKTLLCCLLTCVMVLACALTILPIATPTTANAAEPISLIFPDENFKSNGVGSYADTWTAKIGAYEWSIVKFNNNQWNTWDYIKAGTESSIQTLTLIPNKVSSILVTVTAATTSNIKSVSAIVSSDKNFSTQLEVVTLSKFETGTWEFKFSKATTNCYYKLDFVCGKTKAITISKVQYNLAGEAAHTHTWGEWTHVNGTETHTRTCTADANHTETADCTFNESNTCTVCGYTKVACDHTELTLVPEVAATCTTTGVKEHYKCANVACGKLFDKNTADKQEVTFASLTIVALEHQWNDGEITTAATCTTDGVKTFTCTREGCSETKTETIPALGHNYGADGNARFVGQKSLRDRTIHYCQIISREAVVIHHKILH